MSNRPIPITVISWAFIAFGGGALLRRLLQAVDAASAHRLDELTRQPWEHVLAYVSLTLAVLGGVFTLRGFNWARWLLVAWMGFHVVLGALHSPLQLMVHGLLLGIATYYLYRPQAAAYFSSSRARPPRIPKTGSTAPP